MPRREGKSAPKTWISLRKVMLQGMVARQFTHWITIGIRTHGTSFTFNLHEIMEAYDLDYDKRYDYARAIGYFIKQRKAIEKAMHLYWTSPEYIKYKTANHSDEEIFNTLMSAAISHEIYPMWSDPKDENKYKLFDLTSYLYLKERRARSIVSEIQRTSKELQLVGKEIPKLSERYERPALESRVDGVFIALPSSTTPYCPYCGLKFENDESVVDHIEAEHQSQQRKEGGKLGKERLSHLGGSQKETSDFVCPFCKTGKLRLMEYGDYKCSECKTILKEEDFKTFFPEKS